MRLLRKLSKQREKTGNKETCVMKRKQTYTRRIKEKRNKLKRNKTK